MNVALLLLFAGYNVNAVVTEAGYKAYKQVASCLGSFAIIEECLHRCYGDIMKEVV